MKPKDVRYRVSDGLRLYLVVMPSGTKRWESEHTVGGKITRISLGSWPEVTIQEARERHAELRKKVRAGRNPRLPDGISFGELFEEWYRTMSPSWSPSHAAQRRRHYELYIAGKLGGMDTAAIRPADVAALFTDSLKSKRETARRVHQAVSKTLQYGVAMGIIPSDPSRDVSVRTLLPPSHGKRHFAALTDPVDIGRFMRDVWAYPHSPVVRVALLMTVWTAGRSQEIIGAKWEEIDLESATWTVPAGRMKRRREHSVPLPRQALDLLRELKAAGRAGPWVFPSARSASKHLSDGALLAAIRDLGWDKEQMTPHGARSMFSTYANADGQWEADVIEAQLSHADKNQVRAAYNRSEFLERRRTLMQWYADELDRLRLEAEQASAKAKGGGEG